MTTDGWRELRVSEFAEIVGGATPSTSDASNFGGDIPWVTPKDLSNYRGRLVSRGERNLTRKGVEAAGLRLLPKGTVLLSTRAPIGYVAIAQNPLTTNQGFRSLVVKPKFNPEFVYYLLKQDTERLKAFASGTTFGELSGSTLGQLRFSVPPLPEQRAIASVLGSLDDDIHARRGDSEGLKRLFKHLMKRLLSGEWSTDRAKEWLRTTRPAVQAYDDKIELNRRMNQTLEQIAQALFKSWFVDFDPVRAKAEGRWKKGESLPGMPADMWDLWPSEFEDSEIGEIPRGWHVATLRDVLSDLESGSRPTGGATEIGDDGVPSIGAENVLGLGQYDYSKTKYVPRAFFAGQGRGIVRHGDVLLYKDGAQIGRRSYFDEGFPFDECCINEHVFLLRVRPLLTQRYLYFWLDQDWMADVIVSRNSGSAQPGLNQPAIHGLPILVPSERIVRAYDTQVAPVTRRVFRNQLEGRTLGQLRDTLLPKLLSGEIRVPIDGGR
jgi:type I restriction enzyme S subunit